MLEDAKQVSNGNGELTKNGRLTFGFVGSVLMFLGILGVKPILLTLSILFDPISLGIDTAGNMSVVDGIIQGVTFFFDLLPAFVSTITPLGWVLFIAGILATNIGLACTSIAIQGYSPFKKPIGDKE